MPGTNQPTGRTPPTAAGIDSELNGLKQRVDDLRIVQARSRRITLVLALIVVVEFGLFAYLTTRHVEANFNEKDLQRAVADRVPLVTPELRQDLVTVAQNTLPVYREQATQRFQQVAPEIARDALDRLQKLPQENGEELNRQLQLAFEVALSRIEPEMKSAFPSLSDEQKVTILHQQFLDAVQKENGDLARHVNEIAETELKTMRQVLEKFDVPMDTSDAGRRAREREFLHALVDVMMDGEFTFKTPPAAASPGTRPSVTSIIAPAAPVASSSPVSSANH